MRLDDLHLWFLGDPTTPHYVGALKLVSAGKGVSLRYSKEWLTDGFALSEDLPLVDTEFLPPARLSADTQRAVGAIDDARPDRWGEKVIRFVDKPKRLSLMEYLYYAGDDRFGALGVSTSSTTYSPRSGGALPRLAEAQQLSEVVAKIEASEPLSALEAKIIAGGGSPLGGANAWQPHFAQAGVSAPDIKSLSECIDGEELLTQRTQFDATGFQTAPQKTQRKSPFQRA